MEYLYRCEAVRYSYTIDAELELYGVTAPKIQIDKFEILSRTSKGAWIRTYYEEKKFVLLTARKRYACETEKEAVESFIARRNKQLRILTKQIQKCEEDIKAATYYLDPDKEES